MGQQGRLARSLDWKVTQCLVRYKKEGHKDWSLPTLYEYVQRIDYSLRRIKKRQLEVTIEKGKHWVLLSAIPYHTIPCR